MAEAEKKPTEAGEPQGAKKPSVKIIGIVAARLVDEFQVPVVLIGVQGGVGKGSARSVKGFALHEAFAACSSHLVAHGGHAGAAGLTIDPPRFDAFRDAFVGYVERTLDPRFVESRGPVGIDVAHRLNVADDAIRQRRAIVMKTRDYDRRAGPTERPLGIERGDHIEVIQIRAVTAQAAADVTPCVAGIRSFDNERRRVWALHFTAECIHRQAKCRNQRRHRHSSHVTLSRDH